jgi:hypothetical protein
MDRWSYFKPIRATGFNGYEHRLVRHRDGCVIYYLDRASQKRKRGRHLSEREVRSRIGKSSWPK